MRERNVRVKRNDVAKARQIWLTNAAPQYEPYHFIVFKNLMGSSLWDYPTEDYLLTEVEADRIRMILSPHGKTYCKALLAKYKDMWKVR